MVVVLGFRHWDTCNENLLRICGLDGVDANSVG